MSQAHDKSVPVEIISEDPQTLLLRVTSSKDGKLVVADSFYLGWQCWVNDLITPVDRVFGVFRGIELSAGQSLVKLTYRPLSVWLGAAASALGLVLLAGTSLYCSLKRARPTDVRRAVAGQRLGMRGLLLLLLIPLESTLAHKVGDRQVADPVMQSIGHVIVDAPKQREPTAGLRHSVAE